MSPIFVALEVVQSSLYQEKIGAEFTSLYLLGLRSFIITCHNLGHPSACTQKVPWCWFCPFPCQFSIPDSYDLYGPHFLCWTLGVVPFNTWLISSWEKPLLQAKQLTKWELFLLKMTSLTISSEIHVILCIRSVCNNTYFLLSLR